MSFQFRYQLTRYSKNLARRERSRIEFIHADSFGEAYRRADFDCRAMAKVDSSWEYGVILVEQHGVGGENAEHGVGSFWPVRDAA